MIRPTTRGVALLAVAVATYMAARVIGTWELYLVAVAFAAMTAVAWVMVLAGSRRLQVDRRVTPERPVAGDTLAFSFHVRSGRRTPGLQITLVDATGRLGGSAPVTVEGLGVRGDRTVTAGPWPARRGIHALPEFTALVEDPLGLVRARRRTGEPLRVTVVPRIDDLASCAPCAASGVRHGGGRRRLPTRDAWEFRGIRPHDPGEPLNRVDWKATAKTGSLMLREMEAAAEDDLTVLLSGAAAHDAGEPPDSSFETAVRAAGSMAAFTLRSGHAVSLLLAEQGWRPVRLTSDASSRRRLLAALAQAEPTGPARLGPSLPGIVGGRAQVRQRVLALVVLHMDRDLVGALLKLRRQGVSVSVVHVTDDAGGGVPGRGKGNDGDGADELGNALEAAGLRYIRLHRGGDLPAALAAAPARRPLARAR
jgi:uncharacterized protein (DUF58 family)